MLRPKLAVSAVGVLVGVTGLELRRDLFYKKALLSGELLLWTRSLRPWL